MNGMEATGVMPSPVSSWVSRLLGRELRGWVVLFAVMAALGVLTEGTFFSARNLTNLSRQVAINGVLAVGMTFVILIGGIDLSVGSVVALAGVVAGLAQVYAVNAGYTMGWQVEAAAAVSILLATLTGLACGLFNGWWITRFRIAPFIITLGMMVIARGAALIFSGGAAIAPLTDSFNWLGQEYLGQALSIALCLAPALGLAVRGLISRKTALSWLQAGIALFLGAVAAVIFSSYRGIPVPVVLFAVLAAIGVFVLKQTRLGRYILALGGNAEAAWLSGVPTRQITFGIYVVIGGLAGLCGAVLAARLNGALPTAGELFELDAIAAVVIGGTSLLGGVGSVGGSILGAFFIGVLNNGMSLLNVTEFYQKVIKGVIIILAVWFDTRQTTPNRGAAR